MALWGAFFLLPLLGQGQAPADTAQVAALLAKSKDLVNNDPEGAIRFSLQAKALAQKLGFSSGTAQALKNIGIVHATHGRHLEAINTWKQALEVYRSMNDLAGVSNILNNIGAIYSIQGDNEKALENYLTSLRAAEQSGDKERIWSTMTNVGTVYALKRETWDKALAYYFKALPITEELGDLYGIGINAVNIGEVYSNKGASIVALSYFQKSMQAFLDSKDEVTIPYTYNAMGKEYKKMGRFDEALHYHQKAYATAQKVGNQLFMVQSLIGLAQTYTARRAPEGALLYYKRAEAQAREISALDELKDIYGGLSASYASLKRYDNAYKYQSLYTGVKDALYDIATDKKLATMQFDFDLQKKQGEIDLLTKDKALQQAELKRQKQAQYALLIGLALLCAIAVIIFRNYRQKVKINRVLDRQKEEIEHLLLNILPEEVAHELQVSGVATPRHYDNVSVLFTDFKGFTALADRMSPEELVEELNYCFMAFDGIIEKYNLEKIKTIGDAYMCAGGIPTPDDTHPLRIIKAALEIQNFVAGNNEKRIARGLPPWEARIGIHVGPVVAGVVGKKKYAYDIWGSTVNIASRMETNGVPGQINISAATYEIIKGRYACSHRGKIYAKNVGDIDMYFLGPEIKTPIETFHPENVLQ